MDEVKEVDEVDEVEEVKEVEEEGKRRKNTTAINKRTRTNKQMGNRGCWAWVCRQSCFPTRAGRHGVHNETGRHPENWRVYCRSACSLLCTLICLTSNQRSDVTRTVPKKESQAVVVFLPSVLCCCCLWILFSVSVIVFSCLLWFDERWGTSKGCWRMWRGWNALGRATLHMCIVVGTVMTSMCLNLH